MEKINFKPLATNQIEVRPTNTKFKGSANLLLYIDSRCAANILNDAVGEFNWQIEYKPINDKVYGRLSIWDNDKKQWVYKEDTGSESNIEAEKGQASDILKRCIARWGCDYLYTAPDIKISCPDNYYFNDKMTMKFNVKEIEYTDKKISKLIIVDRFNNEVYNWTLNGTTTQSKHPVQTVVEDAVEVATVVKTVVDKKQMLKEFVVNNHTEENETEIKRFYNYYLPKMEGWKGNINLTALFEKWLQPKTA